MVVGLLMKKFNGLLCERGITLSTWLTIVRLCLIPSICYYLYKSKWSIALGIFSLAAVSDFLDGYLARLRKEETRLGAYLDPIADKLLVSAIYITLFFSSTPYVQVPLWFLLFMLSKEGFLLVGGYVLYKRHNNKLPVNVSMSGKAAMFVQVLFVAWLLLVFAAVIPSYTLLTLWLTVITLFASFAFFDYSMQGFVRW